MGKTTPHKKTPPTEEQNSETHSAREADMESENEN